MRHAQVYILGCIFALVSCQKDPDIPIVSLTVNDNVQAEWLTANLSGAATSNTKVNELFVQLSTNEDFGVVKEMQASYNKGQFVVVLSDLTPQTTYYYRYRGANKLNTYTDQSAHSFKTKDYTVPVVTTDSVNHITGKKANLFGTIVFDCAKEITDRGFEYGVSQTNLTKVPTTDKDFYIPLSTLQFGTTYYYRAYATSEIGTGYGELKSFKTCDVVKFGEIKIDSIMANSARAEYSILSNGGMPIILQGFQYWGKGVKDTAQIITSKAIKFTNLVKDQTYQLRAFAQTEDSCFYSAISEFTTKDGVIGLTTTEPTNISYTTATLGGKIMDDGGATITERGVCWSTQSNPTIANSKQTSIGGTYSCNISDLTDNTTYYVRAYAINQYGTYYGEEKTFTTKIYTVPTVSTSEVTNISYTTATCGGEVMDDGGQSVTERGFCYSTTSNPTTSDNKITSGSGTGSFSCNLTGLTNGTTYYVRAYAVNSKGTSYGEERTFTTTAYSMPTVANVDVTNRSYNSATCNGELISDGGREVVECGICYATTTNPTIDDIKVVASGKTIGTFTCSLSDLTEGTKYYVRAYATNSIGTSYSSLGAFVTKGPRSGTATVLSSSGRSNCEWVQLWEDGPKWAIFNVGATITNYADPKIGADPSSYLDNGIVPSKYLNTANCGGLYPWNNPNYNGRITIWQYYVKTGVSDVATSLWGNNWRTSNRTELNKLMNDNYTTWTWCDGSTTQFVDGCEIKGFKVSGKGDFVNYSIFLPTAGCCKDGGGTVDNQDLVGYYWSCTEYDSKNAYYIYFLTSGKVANASFRETGRSIRAVLVE